MTATALDVDVLEHLDWDHEQPCTCLDCRDGRGPARWRITYYCGCVFLACHPCREKLRRWLQARANDVVVATCGSAISHPILGRDVVRSIEPL